MQLFKSRNFLLVFAIVCIFLIHSKYAQQVEKYTPVMLGELFRHGARAPFDNPDHDEWITKVGYGNLTFAGLRQHYVLGRQRRLDYPNLFSTPISNFAYELHSSPIPRCLLSAEAHFQGIYGEGTGESVPENFKKSLLNPSFNSEKLKVNFTSSSSLPHKIRLFPIETNDYHQDKYFYAKGYGNCKNANQVKADTIEELRTKYDKSVRPIVDKLYHAGLDPNHLINKPSWNLETIYYLWDLETTTLYYTGKLHKWMPESIYEELNRAIGIHWSTSEWVNPAFNKFAVTNIMKRIKEAFEDKIMGKSEDLKYVGFSGHDTNIYPFLVAHGLSSTECAVDLYEKGEDQSLETCINTPGFASSFLWELSKHKDNNNWYIKIFYDGDPIIFCDNPVDDKYCEFYDWKKKIEEEMIFNSIDYQDFCGSVDPDKDYGRKYYKSMKIWRVTAIISLVFVFLFLLVIIGLSMRFWGSEKDDNRDDNSEFSEYQAENTDVKEKMPITN